MTTTRRLIITVYRDLPVLVEVEVEHCPEDALINSEPYTVRVIGIDDKALARAALDKIDRTEMDVRDEAIEAFEEGE